MRTTKTLIAVTGAALLLTACDVKDPIYETDHPEKGKITVTTDWSGMGSGITKPSGYTIALDGATFPATADEYTLPDLFDPGNYTIYAWNTADKIAVSGTTATVAASGGGINSLPGWLFTGKADAEVRKDTDHDFTVVMAQQVRQLTLVIEPTGGTVDRIEGIAASLSGVAGTLDFGSGTHGTPSNVALAFTKQATGDHAGKWAATVRLLGVTGTEQKLTGTIAFTSGTPAAVSLESGLTALLSGFNADKKTPLTLGAQVVEAPTSAGFTATITEWNEVTGGNGIAY